MKRKDLTFYVIVTSCCSCMLGPLALAASSLDAEVRPAAPTCSTLAERGGFAETDYVCLDGADPVRLLFTQPAEVIEQTTTRGTSQTRITTVGAPESVSGLDAIAGHAEHPTTTRGGDAGRRCPPLNWSYKKGR